MSKQMDKPWLILLVVFLPLITGCSEKVAIPSYLNDYQEEFRTNPRQANLHWFRDAGYGMFIHYGLYSQLEKGEWVQLRDTIPVAEYAKLKDSFTAENFDADRITDIAIEAGMKYIKLNEESELIVISH